MRMVIKDCTIITDQRQFAGDVLIENDRIAKISTTPIDEKEAQEINAKGLTLLPGCIDDQVHFREPGLTHKGTIKTESRAAVAGGITSFMEMPNTKPQALTQSLLKDKYDIAAKDSLANYSFYMGASNDNLEEVLRTNGKNVCGIKVFMGSSTGNMLVDDEQTLKNIFSNCELLIATHCEDEDTIKKNTKKFRKQYGEKVPFHFHHKIRSEEACYLSSSRAVSLAKQYGARLHVLHISTKKELDLFTNELLLAEKKITAEACVHHLWFCDEDYHEKGAMIKWNPAVKRKEDRDAIFQAVLDDRIDVIATDHAPHTLEEKQQTYFKAPSGGPLVQHALLSMLDHWHNGKITLEKIVEKMCHAPADCFHVIDRGYIREGYKADLVLVDLNKPHAVSTENLLYKCGWSPFSGYKFKSSIHTTIVNGKVAYQDGKIIESGTGERLSFNR